MASIIQISGSKNKVSTPNTRWSITANEACLFEVPDWIPKTTPDPKGGILAVPPAQIELGTRAKVTWQLKDKTQKILFKTIASNVLDKFNLSINKKYSGSYTYFLEAKLDGKSDVASTFVSGFCDPKITVAKWSKKEGTNDTSDVKCGNIVYVTLDTEGLNGDKLTFEFFSEKDTKKSIASVTEECINGDCVAKIPTIGAAALTKTATESFYVKVKNAAGVYIKNGGDEKVIKFKILKDVVPPVADVPTNTTVLKVGEPDKVTLESTGIISLEKIAVNTTYDVCNDEVGKFDDYKNFWILEDKKEYFHWLKKRTNADDLAKPAIIPITLASTEVFSFKATFETILPAEVKVRVRDKQGKYIFKEKSHPKKAKKELYPIEFISTNTPYANTVQYFENFELIFEYSVDGISWTPMGSATFCFYMTWDKPEYKKFEINSDQNITMQIENKSFSKKSNILETLLWIGCKQAKEKGNLGKNKEENEEQILNAIFKEFSDKKVVRSREGTYKNKNWTTDGMGYWRGISAVDAQSKLPPGSVKPRNFYDAGTGTHIGRNSRVIFKYGEFRCGEWTDFFIYIAMTQGILLKQFAIYSGNGGVADYYFIYDRVAKKTTYENPDLKSIDPKTGATETHFANWEFYVGDKGWTFADPAEPVLAASTTNRAQGNKDPLHTFSDHVFAMFERKGKKMWFDPSYGITSATKHANDKDLLREYATNALERMGYLNIYNSQYQTFKPSMEKHIINSIIEDLYFLPKDTMDKAGIISIIDSKGKTIKTF